MLPDGSGYLAAFWSTSRANEPQDRWRHCRAYTTGFVSPTSRNWDGVRGPPKGLHTQQAESRPYVDHSPHATRRWLDAISVYTSSVWHPDSLPEAAPVAYLPYSNGTPPQAPGIHQDTDDARFIADNFCISLQALVDICRCESLAPEDACPEVRPMTSEPEECSFGE